MSRRAAMTVCTGLFAALVASLSLIVAQEPEFAALALVLGLVLLAPILMASHRGTFDPLESLYIFLPMYAYVYLAKPVTRLVFNEDFLFGKQDLEWAMTVAIIGLLAMFLGYYSSLGPALARQVPVLEREVSSRNVRRCAWTYILVGAIGLWLYMENSGGWRQFWSVPHGYGGKVEGSSAYIWQLPELMVVGFFLFLYDATTRQRMTVLGVMRIVVASLGGIGVYTILWTRRTFILWTMITAFVLYFLWQDKRPRLRAIILFGVVLFLAIQLAITYRPYLHLGSTVEDLAQAEVKDTRSLASQQGDEFDSFLAIVNLYPKYFDYDYFAMYLRIPLHPIPRFLWPDKPPLFNSSWQGFLFHSGIVWGSSESLLGDLYVQLGLIGVVFGMFASGILWRFLFAYLQRAPRSGFMQLVYAVAIGNVPSFVLQSGVGAFWKWFPLMIPGILFAYWVSRRPAPIPRLDQLAKESISRQ